LNQIRLKQTKQLTSLQKAFGVGVFFICIFSFIAGLALIWKVACGELDLKHWEFGISMTFLGGFGGLATQVLKGLFHIKESKFTI